MRYLFILLLLFFVSCTPITSDDPNVNTQEATVKYFGSSEYEGTYLFKVMESEEIIYNQIEIDTGDFTPVTHETYCMNLEQIELRDYKLISFCD